MLLNAASKTTTGLSQLVSERKAQQIQRFNLAKSTSDSTLTSKLDFRSDPIGAVNGASDDEVKFGICSAITTVSGNDNILSPPIAHGNEQNLNPNQVKVNPTSVFNKKNAVLKPFDGNLEGDYSCNHCNKDVSRKRVNCKRCFDFNLCIECFSSGAEIRSHKRNHPCRLIEVIRKKEVKSSMLSLKPSRKIMKKHKGKKFGKSCNLFEEIIEYDYKTKDTLYIHRSKRTPAINLEVKLDEYLGDFMLSNSLQPNQLSRGYDEPNLVTCTILNNGFYQKEDKADAYHMYVEMVVWGSRQELIYFSALKCEHGDKQMLVDKNILSQTSIHLLPDEKEQNNDENFFEDSMLMEVKLEASELFTLPWPAPHMQSLFSFCNFFFVHHLVFGKLSCVHKMFGELHEMNLADGSKIVNGTTNIFIFDPGDETFDVRIIFLWLSTFSLDAERCHLNKWSTQISVATFGEQFLDLENVLIMVDGHLYTSFEEIPGEFQFTTAITSSDLEEIHKFLDIAVNSSCEGVIIKTLNKDATYEPAKSANDWLKLKKDYMDRIGDSLDLVPIAAFHGRGKHQGVYGSFLLACYDEHNEEYQSICNIGTGFSWPPLFEYICCSVILYEIHDNKLLCNNNAFGCSIFIFDPGKYKPLDKNFIGGSIKVDNITNMFVFDPGGYMDSHKSMVVTDVSMLEEHMNSLVNIHTHDVLLMNCVPISTLRTRLVFKEGGIVRYQKSKKESMQQQVTTK